MLECSNAVYEKKMNLQYGRIMLSILKIAQQNSSFCLHYVD